MKRSLRVSIIILNWNGWKDTLECLESLNKVAYPNYEVFVVDNGSTDDSKRYLKTFKPSNFNLTFIFNKKNLGFAEGNNVAIRKILVGGKSDFILLLNNDVVVEKNFLFRLVKEARVEEKIGILGPRIYYYSKSKRNVIQSAGSRVNLYLGRFSRVKSRKSTEVDFVTGACFLIKTEVIEKIGLLDKKYFLNFEDADWCMRAKSAGYLVWYVPKAIVWHKVSRSFRGRRALQIYYYTRNLFWFEFNYANSFQLVVFLIYYLLLIFPQYFWGYLLIKRDFRLWRSYVRGVVGGLWR